MSLANRAPVGAEAFHSAVVRCSIFYNFVLVKLEYQLGLKRFTALSYAFAAATASVKNPTWLSCVCVCVCVIVSLLAHMGEIEGVGTWTIGAERVSEGAHTCAACIRTCHLRRQVF